MRIVPVDNTNFNAKFYNNQLLEKVLAKTENNHLKNFLDILKRMERVNDGREFYLEIVPMPLIGGDYLVMKGVENYHGFAALQIWDYEAERINPSALERVNVCLNHYYPFNPKIELPTKDELLKEIHEKLDINA